MKKVLAIILCGVILSALCACAKPNATTPTGGQPEETKSYVGGNEGSRGENPVRPEHSYR